MPTLCKNEAIQLPLIADISKTETHIFSSNLQVIILKEVTQAFGRLIIIVSPHHMVGI